MNAFQVAVAAVSLLGLAFGAILDCVSRRFTVEDDLIVEKIDGILPQSQCGRCDYPGYRLYTEAISCNGEKINRCAPGGETVILKITELPNVEPQPLDDEAPELAPMRMVAVVDENSCIGCTKYIQACPVDAIVGATRAIYTVMSDPRTSRSLYVGPCPTHCISPQPVAETPDPWKWDLDTIPVRIIPVEHHA